MNSLKMPANLAEQLIDKVVDTIASEEDKGFFRGFLKIIYEESSSSAQFVYRIQAILKEFAK